jgi:hypothetical protein
MASSPSPHSDARVFPFGEVIEIRAGHQPSKGQKLDSGSPDDMPGIACLLSPKSFSATGDLIQRDLQMFSLDKKALHTHSLKAGDVLLQCKGSAFKAFPFHGEPSGAACFAGPTFLRLRLKNESGLRPGFLVWYLNHEATQRRLETYKKGSAMSYISAKSLNEFSLTIPTQSVQAMIEAVNTEFKVWRANQSTKTEAMKALVESTTWNALVGDGING